MATINCYVNEYVKEIIENTSKETGIPQSQLLVRGFLKTYIDPTDEKFEEIIVTKPK